MTVPPPPQSKTFVAQPQGQLRSEFETLTQTYSPSPPSDDYFESGGTIESPSLELQAINHGYGDRPVVRDVSLSLMPGRLLCLLGPSGCGKTTTLRIAAGLEHPWSGQVRMNGQLVTDGPHAVPPERRRIGFLFQDFALFPHLSVADNVAFGITHLPRTKRQERVARTLQMVGMTEYGAAYPHTLSGGQQQRVALARALAPEPQLMLLDEPFSGLDARLRHQIREETFQVLRKNKVAAVMVTHDPEEAMYMADQIALMDGGRVIQQGPPEDLYHQPTCPFAARFFGEINELPSVVRNGRADTPVGLRPAPGLAEGTDCLVMVRPEGFILTPTATEGQPRARILGIRHLGRIHDITLAVEAEGIHKTLHAHIHTLPPVTTGDMVGLELIPDEVFVFART